MLKKISYLPVYLLFIVCAVSFTSVAQPVNPLYEGFEEGTKQTYSPENIKLSSGSWTFDNALIGQSSFDKKNGNKSVRINKQGTITMNFDYGYGSTKLITLYHSRCGNDAPSVWALYFSVDGAKTWQMIGDSVTSKDDSIKMITFIKSYSGKIRFQIRKLSGGRLNIDDMTIAGSGVNRHLSTFGTNGCGCSTTNTDTIPTRDDNLAMGNPSNATTNTTDSNNYLIAKSQYTVSYNNSYGAPNWTSWHLSSAWKGSAARCDCFTSDASLPTGYTKVTTSNYTNTGFDRGHLCPSEDRDGSDSDNRATFIMTNITPQAPILNQQTWVSFETYCRTLMSQGNELYIVAGGYGSGGTGSNGGDSLTINKGKINVYAHYWKVAIVLPVGVNDVNRVTTSTRVIAVDMPNNQGVNAHTWDYYRVSVDSIEAATGYNFFSNVPSNIQAAIEASVDAGPTQ